MKMNNFKMHYVSFCQTKCTHFERMRIISNSVGALNAIFHGKYHFAYVPVPFGLCTLGEWLHTVAALK